MTTLPRISALALLSGSTLLLEIGLTRLYSTLYYPPFVFVVLSLAVLGLGLGAGLAAASPALRAPDLTPHFPGVAAILVFLLLVGAMRVATLPAPWLQPILLIPPFLCIGLTVAAIFSQDPAGSPRLYRADLVGAGVGVILAIPLLNRMGPVDTILATALLFSIAGGVLASRLRSFSVLMVVLLPGLWFLGENLGWFQVDLKELTAEKPISQNLVGGATILETRWDAFARTDLVDPMDGAPWRLMLDGAAASILPPAIDNDFLRDDIGLFPFATSNPDRIFIIGPGGGLDVYFALLTQASEIVAVEVNPASVALVNQYDAYTPDLYTDPRVRVVIDEGRSVLRREEKRYDLISLSQVVTLSAERIGYSLTENTVLTVEAFLDYLTYLSDEGQIAIKLYDEITLTRALSTVLAALRSQGLSDGEALSRTVALLDSNSDPPIPLLIVRKRAFSQDEALELGAVARRVGFSPLYLPGVLASPPLDGVEAGTLLFESIVEEAEQDISAVTDDRPFFYQFERGIPANLQRLLLFLAVVVGLGGAGLWLKFGKSPAPVRTAGLYFGVLGAGFMMVEIVLIQQTRLFLGHPTLAVTTILALLLLMGGIGSGLAARVWVRRDLVPIWPPLLLALLLLAWSLLWPLLQNLFLSHPPVVRIGVVALSLSPIALLIGMPFPLGLRWIGGYGSRYVALGWMVNGVMSVVGSVLAVALATGFGYSRVILGGALLYTLAALLVYKRED